MKQHNSTNHNLSHDQSVLAFPAAFLQGLLALVIFLLLTSCQLPTSSTVIDEFADADSQDVGIIKVGCDPVKFIVSLNDDDDNEDDTEDLSDVIDPDLENNLREFLFDHAKAAEVFVSEPVIIPSRDPAISVRLRAYNKDKRTPFDFSANHSVPVTMFLEGIAEGDEKDDLAFEYQYFKKDGEALCGADAKGKVAKAKMKLSSVKKKDPKLLSKGKITVQIVDKPKANAYAWSYDGSGAFDNAAKRKTKFTAGDVLTPRRLRDTQLVRCTLTFPAGNILLTAPLNVTQPRTVTTATTGALPAVNSNVVRTQNIRTEDRSRQINFFLLRYHVDYIIRDQFGDKITESTRGGAKVTIREVVPLVSDIAAGLEDLQAFFDRKIRTNTTQAWKVKLDGKIKDDLQLGPLTATILRAPNRTLEIIPRTVGSRLCNMAAHEWFVSINSDANLEKRVTNNSMDANVLNFQSQANGESVQFTTVYTVTLVP